MEFEALKLLFLLLTMIKLFAITTQQNTTSTKTIPLNSSISPSSNNSYWLSNSGHFAFGFYQQTNTNTFSLGISFQKTTPKTVLWTFNRDDPPLPRGTTQLLLTLDGKLVLRGVSDVAIYSSSPAAASASMLDSGNFVLYDSDSNVIWQSFDYPTDTLLAGQPLHSGESLISSVDSNTNHSSGRFNLEMQVDGNLVQYPVLTTERKAYHSYFSSNTYNLNTTLNLDPDGRLYLTNTTGVSFLNLSVGTSNRRVQIGEVVTYRLTLDSDGILRLYSHSLPVSDNSFVDWVVEWQSVTDKCAPIGLCGLNSYCAEPQKIGEAANCLCVPGFEYLDPSRMDLGCVRNDLIGCEVTVKNVSMEELVGITWEDDPYWVSTPLMLNKNDCWEECRRDCYCEVAFFLEGQCRKQMLPLKFAKLGQTVSAVFKSVSRKDLITVTAEKQGLKMVRKRVLIVGVSVLVFGVVVFVFALFLVCRSNCYEALARRKSAKLVVDEELLTVRLFTFDELSCVTNGFEVILGRGAFGSVFKGTLLSKNGERVVAVKRLEKVVDEGEFEFRNEIRSIGRIHHRNLLRLLGYCHEGSNRLLVYDYMPNGTLSDFLFNSSTKPDWKARVKIASGVARGILYLHEECESQIIHCDINPNNILIDENHSAKIADFGLAKLLQPDQTRTNTGVRGTRGFVAPEWFKNKAITAKADVYSFGIVLLVIICSRRSVDVNLAEEEIVLVDWVYRCFESNEVGNLVSGEEVEEREVEKLAKIGLWCIQEDPTVRPGMKKVVAMFEGTMEIPMPPNLTSFNSNNDSDHFSG